MDRLGLIEKLFAAYPNTTPSEATFGVYVEVLADIPLAELNTVLLQCIREGGSFPPSAGQLFERWRTLTQPAQLGVSDGWGMVQTEIRRIGSWGTPEFSDPLVAKAVGIMGWLELCQSENGMADRAHFMKIYGDLLARAEQAERLTPASRQLVERQAGSPRSLAASPASGNPNVPSAASSAAREAGSGERASGGSGGALTHISAFLRQPVAEEN